MAQDILLVLNWWFWIQLIGLAAWPLSARFFRSYPDSGYTLSKGLGLILTAFINWWLVSIHVLRFSIVSIIVSIAIVAVASWFLRIDTFDRIRGFMKTGRRQILVTELVFFAAFLGFALIRMGNPDIAQTEKMPDFAFLTGIVTSDHFPPRDPWFADGTINYFYYGHYLIALMTKASGVATEYGYNLGVAFIFAMTLLNAAGVSIGLIRKLWYGVLGGLFVAFIGNLDCAIQLFSNLGKIISGESEFFPFGWFNWWMSSRVIVREGIDITINEFPFWSYILGDLHAHMNVVPISLVVLAIVLEVFRRSGTGLGILGTGKDAGFRLSVAAIVIGAIPCANTWDLPTYYTLMAAALLLGRQFAHPNGWISAGNPEESISIFSILMTPFTEFVGRLKRSISNGWRDKGWSEWLLACLAILTVFALSYLLYIPFHLNFTPAGTEGLRIVNPEQYTLARDFLTIYGFFFYCLLAFTATQALPFFTRLNQRMKPLAGVFMVAMFLTFLIGFQRLMIALCLCFLYLVLVIPMKRNDPDVKEKFFALALVITILLILLGCEFFYIKDAYGKTLERQNTIFKFYYQVWILCGISAAYAVYWIQNKTSRIFGNIWEPGFRILFLCSLMFPIVGSTVKTGNFRSFSEPSQYSRPTLDGMFYMTWQHKGDLEAIKWLRKNADPEERVLEATGPAFSHYGRISAGTGMATVLGWGNHENIWRDGSWKIVNERTAEVKKVYSTGTQGEIRAILDKYRIRYVFLGKLEREQYPDARPERFSFMEKVLEIKDSDQQMAYLFRYPETVGK